MFHKGKDGKAQFGGSGGMSPKTTTTEVGGKVKGQEMKEKQQAPHGNQEEQHVTKTNPGETQPHPETGVHAFHAHHMGGGKYKSHTHNEDGSVDTQHHPDAGDMHAAMQNAMPNSGNDDQHDMRDGGNDFAEELGAIGGQPSSGQMS